MQDSFFRVLNEEEEAAFRQYARDNKEVCLAYTEEELAIRHPAVRDEIKKMKEELNK